MLSGSDSPQILDYVIDVSWLSLILISYFGGCRCINRWKMVLHSILGGGEIEHAMGLAEEQIDGGVPFFSVG